MVHSGVLLIVLLIGIFVSASEPWINSLVDLSTAGTVNEVGLSFELPPMEWNGTYGGASYDYAYSVVQTSDGGYAVAGCTFSYGAGYSDFWLVKVDAEGNALWNQTYGGTGNEEAHALVQTSDGGYAIAGYTESYGAGGYDFWLVKTDRDGYPQWNQTYGGVSTDYLHSMVQTSDGGYALAGITYIGGSYGEFWLVKTDENGDEQWNQTYGRADSDEAFSVVQTSEGGYALAGRTYSYGEGYNDFWLVKTDEEGNEQWNKTYGRSSQDCAYSVVQTSDGGYALVGHAYLDGESNFDFWLVKTDSNGDAEWNVTYGGAGDDAAFSMAQTSDGGYALAGWTGSFGVGYHDFWLVRTDLDGSEQWNKTYGGTNDEYAEALVPTSGGGYALAGAAWTSDSSFDFWVVKVAGSIYIRADGSVDPPTAPIDRDNDLYRLTGNITCSFNGIVIERDNMTLDGNGFTLKGSGVGNGLSLDGRVNVTATNMTIESFEHGVQANNSGLIALNHDLRIMSNGGGVTFSNTNDSTIISNSFLNNSRWAIHLASAVNNTISLNDLRNNGYNTTVGSFGSIAIGQYSSNNRVLNNRIANPENRSRGLHLNQTSGNIIYQNNLTDCGLVHVSMYNSSNNVIEQNIIGNYPLLLFAVWIMGSDSNQIRGNNISGRAGVGFILRGSINNSISRNNVVWSDYGLGFDCSSSNFNALYENSVQISNNPYSSSYPGIRFQNSVGNDIQGNYVMTNDPGIMLANCSETAISDNKVTNSSFYGIRCNPASNNISIVNNTITDCYYGLSLENSSNVTISENNITANKWNGIHVNGSSCVLVKQNHVEENYEGIVLTFCNSVNVSENNLLSNNVTAIRLSDSSGVYLHRNNVTGSLGDGILLEAYYFSSSDNTLEENTVSLSGDTGLLIRSSQNTTLRGNTLANNKYNFGIDGWVGSDFVQDIDTSNTVDGKPIHWLTGVEDAVLPADAGYVALINCTQARIENLSLAKNVQSILLISTNKTIITDNNISDCKAAGIQLHTSLENLLSRNRLSTIEGTAILLYESLNNTVQQNFAENVFRGIYAFDWNGNNTIIENTLVNCSEAITVGGGLHSARQNNITSASTGISVEGYRNDIADNIIANVSIGIRVTGPWNTVSGNNITEAGEACIRDVGYLSTVEGNILMSSSIGVKSSGSYGLRIVNNSIMNNVQGIYLSGPQNTIISNVVKSNTYGVYLEGAYECLLRKNIIEENTYAIYLDLSSSLNRIADNNITNNAYGFYFFENALNNTMYQNNMVNNTHQVYDRSWDDPNATASISIWDNGYRLRGNYWDDYNGTDADLDGIGDTPYVIDEYNQDRYPLMQMWTPTWDEALIIPTGQPIVDIAVASGWPCLYANTEKSFYMSPYGIAWYGPYPVNFSLTSVGFVWYGDAVFCGKDGLYYGGDPSQLVLNVSGYTKALGLFNNTLYVGTFLDDSPTLYYCVSDPWNSSNWYIDTGFSDIMNSSAPFGGIDSFAVHNDWMYVAAGNTIYSFDGTTWSIVKTFDDVYSVLDMTVYNGRLCLATRDQPWRKSFYQGGTGFSGRVIEFDGQNWTTILEHDYWIFSLAADSGTLYAGTANRILAYNGTEWSVSYEANDSACYVISLATLFGQVYAGTGNGLVLTHP